MTGLLIVEVLRKAWAFVRGNWQAIALTGAIVAAGWMGWHWRGKWDAAARERLELRVEAQASLAAARASAIDRWVASDAQARATIADLIRRMETQDAALLAAGERRRAMDAAIAERDRALAASRAERQAEAARAAMRPYDVADLRRALDELALRQLEMDPRAPAGKAAELRRLGYGGLSISGGS